MRILKGWARDDLGTETDLAVAELAKNELNRGRMTRRYEAKRRSNKPAGLCLTTLASIEQGKPAFPFTIKIVATALGVEMHTLIHPHDPFNLE